MAANKECAEKGVNTASTVKRVLLYVKPYLLYVVFSILCAGICVGAQLLIPVLCGNAIDRMIGAGKVDFQIILETIVKIVLVVAVTAFAQWIQTVCNNKTTFKTAQDIRNDAIQKIQKLPLHYLDSHMSGDIVSRVIADVDSFADGLLMGFTQLFSGVITIIGTIVIMLTVNLPVTLVVVCLTPVSLLVSGFIVKHTYTYFQKQNAIRGEQTAIINEHVEGLRIIQAMDHEARSIEQFDEANEKLRKASLNAVFYSSLTNPSTRLVNNIVYAAVALTGCMFAVAGSVTVGQLSVFLSYASQYAKPFNEISGVITELSNSVSCAARVFALLDENSEEDVSGQETGMITDGKVDLDHVYFRYVKEHPLIEDFTLHVKPGQKIAIVGPTGCGKTTMINLLMRFYDVDSGKIKVSGNSITEMSRHTLRSCYGMVLQDTWLKNGTIRENIAYGKADASMNEIIEAAKTAHAHGFIRRLPMGYDTVISEDGGNLSQGQKQLLCIARVMLTLPPMLILDEATSSIDTRTEMYIQNAFTQLMKGRTSFIVAHRLSTIKEADIILVMRDGHIVEQGNHDELLRLHGFYEQLYNSQYEIIT